MRKQNRDPNPGETIAFQCVKQQADIVEYGLSDSHEKRTMNIFMKMKTVCHRLTLKKINKSYKTNYNDLVVDLDYEIDR